MKLAQGYTRRLEEADVRGRLMVTASENSLSVPTAVSGGKMAFYGATKHALLVAMEWLRIEQEEGVLDLHVLMPGAVYTPLVSGLLPDPSLAPTAGDDLGRPSARHHRSCVRLLDLRGAIEEPACCQLAAFVDGNSDGP